jgi:hypothetical protein
VKLPWHRSQTQGTKWRSANFAERWFAGCPGCQAEAFAVHVALEQLLREPAADVEADASIVDVVFPLLEWHRRKAASEYPDDEGLLLFVARLLVDRVSPLLGPLEVPSDIESIKALTFRTVVQRRAALVHRCAHR